jgi:hypothetical protein
MGAPTWRIRPRTVTTPAACGAHLRKHNNILKRQLIHISGFNLSLIFRRLLGAGTPREWNDLGGRLLLFLVGLFARRTHHNLTIGLVEASCDRRIQLLYINGNSGSHQDLLGISYLHHGLLSLKFPSRPTIGPNRRSRSLDRINRTRRRQTPS